MKKFNKLSYIFIILFLIGGCKTPDKKFNDNKDIDCKMLLQIHDELIFEVAKIEIEKIRYLIQEEMTSVVKSDLHSFSIPLTVDINFGENWGILH